MTAMKVFIQRSRFVCQISIHIANDGDAAVWLARALSRNVFQSTSPMMAMPLFDDDPEGLTGISIHIANDGDAF